MAYNVNTGVLVPFVQKFYKQMIVVIAGLFIASMAAMTFSVSAAPKNPGSNGKVTFDTNVAWNGTEMYYGDGIDNGEWVVAEVQGVELGLRATGRTEGLLGLMGTNGNRIGMYEASTGFQVASNGSEVARWNYEWSVDLSGAKANAAGRDLSDYSLSMVQNFTNDSLYGVLGNDPVNLPMVPGVCEKLTVTLCQQSWNPTFGNDDFDYTAEGTYDIRMVLTPATFNGPSISVAIQVNVTEPTAE